MNLAQIPSPCYVLDEAKLRSNLELIRFVRDRSGAQILLALKGFAMWSAFPILKEYGFDCAAASGAHEARLAYEELGQLAHTYSPSHRDVDFGETLRYSSHITFNSINQFQRFSRQLVQGKHSAGLRVNPEFSEVETALYNPCAPGSRLGITCEQLGQALPHGIEGLHVHTLCESSAQDFAKLVQAFDLKFGHLLEQIKWVNFGGGHLMTREAYEIDLLIQSIVTFKNKYPHLHVLLEPGAAFAWETGFLRGTIEDIVSNQGIKTAILDISFTAHMPDCLEMPYQPRVRQSIEAQPGLPKYRLGGSSCLSGDWMGDWYFAKELQIGDLIIFEDMIHYTMVKTSTFNGVPHPAIGIWTKEQTFKLIRTIGYEDYKSKLS